MDLGENANARLKIPIRFLSFLCHTFAEGWSPRWLRIFKNAFNMVSTCPWYLCKSFLWDNISTIGALLGQFVLECPGSQFRLCPAFAGVRSPRWLRIFKKALNMMSTCPWYIRKTFLNEKISEIYFIFENSCVPISRKFGQNDTWESEGSQNVFGAHSDSSQRISDLKSLNSG